MCFDERRYIPEIDRMAWGWLEYDQPLTPDEISDYELIAGNCSEVMDWWIDEKKHRREKMEENE